MKFGAQIKRALLAMAVLLCSPQGVEACAVCFGKTNDRLQIGMNYGIGVLLVVIFSCLAGISGFFFYVAARSKRVRSELKTNNFPNSAQI